MNKKTKIAIIGIVALVLVTIAITYAYWLITRTQEGENVITTGCLDIDLIGENDIALANQFPISDEEGMKLTPYEFTITNNCNTSVDYQVALEALEAGDEISSDAIKVALDEEVNLLSSYVSIDPTVDNAYEAKILKFSKLSSKGDEGSSVSYSLRIWIDADAPISEMNKTFKSKISVTVGQGVQQRYHEGSLAYNIMSNYAEVEEAPTFGSAIDTTVTTRRFSGTPCFGTKYSFDADEGLYSLAGEITCAKVSECRAGALSDGTEISCGNYSLGGSGTSDVSQLFEIAEWGTSGTNLNVIKYYPTIIFKSASQDNTSNLYKAEDDLGTSYYFRGDVENNYVKFGEWLNPDFGKFNETSEYKYYSVNQRQYFVSQAHCDAEGVSDCIKLPSSGDSMYWRIVRINGDGTVRLIYEGTSAESTGGKNKIQFINFSVFDNGDELKHVGYTYDDGTGNQVDSTVKNKIDTWYTNNLESSYGRYISDGIFCNNRETISTTSYGEIITETPPYDGWNTYNTMTTFIGSEVYLSGMPTLTCQNKSDRYTLSTSLGNGLLTKPVGLLTADEAIMAGADMLYSNANYYLSSYESWLTMTPYYYRNASEIHNSYTDDSVVFKVPGNELYSFVKYNDSDNSAGIVYEGLDNVIDYNAMYRNQGEEITYEGSGSAIRPVINIKANVQFTGSGTIESPYELIKD